MFYRENLSLIRTWRGYSQRELSSGTGFSQEEISKYESGTLVPDENKTEVIAFFYECLNPSFPSRTLYLIRVLASIENKLSLVRKGLSKLKVKL